MYNTCRRDFLLVGRSTVDVEVTFYLIIDV